MATFLVTGSLYIGPPNGDGVRTHYKKNETVQSNLPLDKQFPGVLKLIALADAVILPVTEGDKKKTKVSKSEKKQKDKDLGKDVTEDFPVGEKKMQVFLSDDEVYNVINSDTGEVLFSDTKSGKVNKFLRTPTK